MSLESESGPRPRKFRKRKWALAIVLVAGLTVFLWNSDIPLFQQEHTATVLVLDDCDPDFRTSPFEDAVIAFAPKGKSSRMVSDLNICQTVGGGRSLAVSPDGKFFVVCESVGKHLKAYETQNGKLLWRRDGEFTSATVAKDGRVYAVISSGTIWGERTVVIDEAGRITTESSTGGFDMALDAERKVLWQVGKSIKRCDLDLKVLQEINPVKWCAVSVDINPDGSIWVAEREHPDVAQSTDRILKISGSGEVLKSVNLAWSPLCVRVDAADGSVWVTGIGISKSTTERILASIERRTGVLPIGKKLRDLLKGSRVWSRTHKYDSEGKLLHEINEGGYSIDIEESDGSVWLAGRKRIYHYSREGKKLAKLGGVSSSQKWVVVVPEAKAAASSHQGPNRDFGPQAEPP